MEEKINPKFSIVIPMYNVENEVVRAIKSIQVQQFKDFEVLLLDDGSLDSTLESCRRVIANDRRFILIPCAHLGRPSVLRNTGLVRAAGEYVIFMDADDTLSINALEKLAQAIQRNGDPELLSTRFKAGYEKNGEFIATEEKSNLSEEAGIISGRELLAKISRSKRQLICNGYIGVYRRDFMLAHQLWQSETLSLYEDNEWLPRVVFAARTIAACDYAYYNYIRSGGSITTALTLESLKSVGAATALMSCFFAQNKERMDLEVRGFWAAHTFNALCWYFFNPLYTKKFTRAQYLEAWKSSSPVADAKLHGAMVEMLPYVSRAKRLAWPLLSLISVCGWILPARLYFRILYMSRGLMRR